MHLCSLDFWSVLFAASMEFSFMWIKQILRTMQAQALPPNYIKRKMCCSVDYVFGVIGVLALLVAALVGPCVGWCWTLKTIYVGLGVQGLSWESRSSRQHRLLTRVSVQGKPFVGASRPGQGWQRIPLSCLQQQWGIFCWQQGTRTFTSLSPFTKWC